MPFLLLLILTPPCLQETWPEPGFGMDSPLRTACLTWTAVAAVVAVAGVWAGWVRRSLRRDPGRREDWLARYGAWRLYHLLLLAGVFGVCLYAFGWGWAVQSFFHTASVPPGGELLILAPFLAGLGLSWACFYEIERALHDAGVPPGKDRYWGR